MIGLPLRKRTHACISRVFGAKVQSIALEPTTTEHATSSSGLDQLVQVCTANFMFCPRILSCYNTNRSNS